MALFDGLDPQAQQMAILGLGSRLLQAGGPSPQPTGFGQAIGQAGLGFLGDVQQLQQQAMQRKLRDVQLKKIETELKEAKRVQKIRDDIAAQAERAIEEQTSGDGGTPNPMAGLARSFVSGGLQGAYGQGSDDFAKMGLGMLGVRLPGSGAGVTNLGVYYDKNTKRYVMAGFDKNTSQITKVPMPDDLEPTLPLIPQQTMLPGGGVGVHAMPGRIPAGAAASGGGIVPGITPPITPTQEERNAVGTMGVAGANLGRLSTLFKEKKFDPGPTFAFRLAAGRRGVSLPGIRLSKAEAEAGALIENLEITMLDAIRGAQVGPAEQEKFARMLPQAGQDEAIFEQNVNLSTRGLQVLEKARSMMLQRRPVEEVQQFVRDEVDRLINETNKAGDTDEYEQLKKKHGL